MKTKQVGIFIVMLLIGTVIPAVGTINEVETKMTYYSNLNNCVTSNDLDLYIIEQMEKYHVAGASVSLIKENYLLFPGSYGYANITKGTYIQDTTLFYLASISKTVTAVAMMQLYEDGLFDLDDPINDYLPFQVIHPDFPSVDITFHMLLTHSSGIIDDYDNFQLHNGDSPNPLGEWLEDYLTPGGEHYDPDINFGEEPGTEKYYTNVGFGLVGYLVEIISEIPFDEYCENNVFEPLGMIDTSWFLNDLDIDNIAVPYVWNGNEQVPQPHWGRDFYPASTLRTSVLQLNNYLKMIINNGEYNSNQILEESTIDYMLTVQLPFHQKQGISFYKYYLYGRNLWAHHGGLPGVATFLSFYTETNSGVIVLTNGDESDESYNFIDRVTIALYDFAETPYKPNINGPQDGKPGEEYEYTFNAIDPDGDDVKYNIDWGNGNTETTEFNPSGEDVIVKHIWSERGTYTIKATAEDSDRFVGPEGTLSVTMPKNKPYINTPFLQFLENHQRMFPLLRQLLGV